MRISDELEKLSELFQYGKLTREEFEIAKRKVLESPQTSRASSEQDQLEAIRLQNEIAQLNRQWEIERREYMVPGRYGHSYVPGKSSSLFGGVMIVCFGIFWTLMASSISSRAPGPFSLFPLFGVLFIFFGIGISFYSFLQAEKYQLAKKRYEQRRRKLLNSQDENYP